VAKKRRRKRKIRMKRRRKRRRTKNQGKASQNPLNSLLLDSMMTLMTNFDVSGRRTFCRPQQQPRNSASHSPIQSKSFGSINNSPYKHWLGCSWRWPGQPTGSDTPNVF